MGSRTDQDGHAQNEEGCCRRPGNEGGHEEGDEEVHEEEISTFEVRDQLHFATLFSGASMTRRRAMPVRRRGPPHASEGGTRRNSFFFSWRPRCGDICSGQL